MRKVKRWRYYCDYCKKSGGSKYHLEKHERGCTNNPDRVCGLCDYSGGGAELSELIAVVKESIICTVNEYDEKDCCIKHGTTEKEVLDKLRELTDCPACILSAIRQSGAPYLFVSFEFKDERDSVFAEHNREQTDMINYVEY